MIKPIQPIYPIKNRYCKHKDNEKRYCVLCKTPLPAEKDWYPDPHQLNEVLCQSCYQDEVSK